MATFAFISGDDDFLVQQRGKQIFDTWAAEIEDGDEFSREVIDGQAGNAEEVARVLDSFRSAVQTLSLFGTRKVVWLRGITFLGDNVTGRAKGTQEMLEERLRPALEAVDGDAVRAVLTASPVDRRRSFAKWLIKAGQSEHLAAGEGDPSAFYPLIRRECEAVGAEIDREAMDLLVERVSGSARVIGVEAAKLATYAGAGGRIDRELVNDLVPHYGDTPFFEATEVFYGLNLERALEALRRHFFTHKESRGLISNLQSRNRLLIQLRVLLDAGALSERINAASLSRAAGNFADLYAGVEGKSPYNIFTQHPFYLSRLASVARKVPLKRLIDFQAAFLLAFEEVLERPNDQEAVMRETFIRCLAD